ncbi:MAG: glycoside hydrolase family 88 protein [Clostridia bacterium]|nr:glycoside hydrolase family 88 protein [Clostridia bacterium]
MEPIKIAKGLFDHYESIEKIEGYYGLLALYALMKIGVEAGDEEAARRAAGLLADYPDRVEHPHYNFINYKDGGNGKAYAVYHGYCRDQKELLRTFAEETLKAPMDKEGISCRLSKTGVVRTWIDIAMAVTPFMLYAGLALKEDRYVDFAAEQTFKMIDRFLDPETGLMHQGKGFMLDPEAISEDHWGRGNGWAVVALASLAEDLPQNSPHRPRAERDFVSLCRAFLPWQNHKNVWRQELTMEASWDESSGTALILYGFGVGLRLGLLDADTFRAPFEKGLAAMTDLFINPDFSTNMCCKGCLCPGTTPERKGRMIAYVTDVYPETDEHHSFGALMLALLEARRNGVDDLGTRW